MQQDGTKEGPEKGAGGSTVAVEELEEVEEEEEEEELELEEEKADKLLEEHL